MKLARGAVAALLVGLLAACVTPQLPMSGEAAEILDLRCSADGLVAATALTRQRAGSLGTAGAILHSSDSGSTWQIAARDERLEAVTPRFFDDPRDERSLIVAGYEATAFIQWTYPLAGWLGSADFGRTWAPIADRLPAVGSRDPVGRPPPLIVVDSSGRLATLRRAPSAAVLTSDDRGATWNEARLPDVASAYHLLGNGGGRLLVVGRGERGVFGPERLVVVRSEDSGRSWSVTMDHAADHLACNPRIMGNADGAILIYNPCPDYGKRYYFSNDGGKTWQARVFFRYAFGSLQLATQIEGVRWVGLSVERGALFAWISDNAGADWHGRPVGFAIPGGAHLYEQSILALPGGVVLAYVGNGQVLRSADRGESWKVVDAGLPRKDTFRLGASCTDGRRLVVLGGGEGILLRSTDAGVSWKRGETPSMLRP